jgi:hypothetical protein
VQGLIDTGALTEEEAEQSDKKNQITKAIGIFEKAEPTVTESAIPLMKNDTILLCSDGLTGHVNKQTIYEIVNVNDDVQLAAMELIEKANKEGGTDNITVQIIHYTGKSAVTKKKRPLKKYVSISVLLILLIIAGVFGYNKIFNHGKENKITKPQSENSVSNKEDSAKVKITNEKQMPESTGEKSKK